MDTETSRTALARIVLIAAIALVIGFLAGFIFQYSRTSDYSTLRNQSQISQLRDELVQAHMEVMNSNFGQAQQYTTKFFNDLRAFVASTRDEQLKNKIWPMLQKRDEITTLLAQANPAAEKHLRALLTDLYAATSGAGLSPARGQ